MEGYERGTDDGRFRTLRNCQFTHTVNTTRHSISNAHKTISNKYDILPCPPDRVTATGATGTVRTRDGSKDTGHGDAEHQLKVVVIVDNAPATSVMFRPDELPGAVSVYDSLRRRSRTGGPQHVRRRGLTPETLLALRVVHELLVHIDLQRMRQQRTSRAILQPYAAADGHPPKCQQPRRFLAVLAPTQRERTRRRWRLELDVHAQRALEEPRSAAAFVRLETAATPDGCAAAKTSPEHSTQTERRHFL